MSTVNKEEQQLNDAQANRKKLIIRNLQEVLGEDSLTKLIISGKIIHVYWGTATTGRPHVGYFVPIQKIADLLHAGIRVTILIADLHGFLDNLKSSFELLQNRVLYYESVVKALMVALDVPIDKLHFVRGLSYQLNELYTKDMLRLSSLISLRDAIRAGAEVVKQTDDPLLSGILYPLLQALDEQHLKVDAQFGGVDQRKIFVMAEEQLPKLKFKKRFHLMNPIVPGLTGSKMSSSEEYTKIDLLDSPTTVNEKIDSALCPKIDSGKQNGVLAFYKYVVFPIMEEEKLIIKGKQFTDYTSLEMAFEQSQLDEHALKDFLKSFLNNILSKVQKICYESASFADILFKAYPPIHGNEKNLHNTFEKSADLLNEIVDNPFGNQFKLIQSKRMLTSPFSDDNLPIKPFKVLWRCSPKGQITLAHFYSLLQLRFLKTLGCECSILVSDLDAFLDKAKCPWVELKKRTDNFVKNLKQVINAIELSDLPIKLSSEYEFTEEFTLDMYKMVSVVTREETALIEGGNTVGCYLCPIYFVLDVSHANVDMVLIGSHQEKLAGLTRKIYQSLKFPEDQHPAFLIMPDIIGTDYQRMSATKPEYHFDIQDGTKKIRQKIGKSFCEPGNLKENVALELCRTFVFPFHKYKMSVIGTVNDKVPVMTIERTPENGGNLEVENYEELERLFTSLKLHPADLKAFLCTHINFILDSIRTGKFVFSN